MSEPEAHLAAAAAVAPKFGLEVDSVELLSHSENVVCTVTSTDGARFALRLHRPGYNTLAELESEVAFVDSLRAFGVPVPTPRPAIDGGHYVAVDVDDVVHHVGVVEWVQGAPLGGPLDGSADGLVDHYGRIGSVAAQIRSHAESWQTPAGFERRRWDAEGLVGESPLWGRFWELDALSAAHRSHFGRARDMLVERLGALSTEIDAFGLIHSDLHLGNVMADGDAITVIDFDDAGFGWFMHELAVALHPVSDEPHYEDAKAALIDGYRSVHPLVDEEVELIDLFLLMRSLMIVGWLDARRELPVYEHFGDLAIEAADHVSEFLG